MDILNILQGGLRGKRKDVVRQSYSAQGISGSTKLKESATPWNSKRVKVQGGSESDHPIEMTSFSDTSFLPEWLSEAVLKAGFVEPTVIQRKACPIIIGGHDVIAEAQTGSGKTMAFVLPMLANLNKPSKEFARGLIIAPTRELGQQILREVNHLLSKCAKAFRVKFIDNLPDNVKRVDIAIATPLRLLQLLNEDKISLNDTQMVVFDEADRLLDMGFFSQVDEILALCVKHRGVAQSTDSQSPKSPLQLCFFSATLPPKVIEMAKSAMVSPLTISVGPLGAACSNITQKLIFVGNDEGKMISFKQLVVAGELQPPVLIFVNSKEKASKLCAELLMRNVLADCIHSDRSKAERDRTIQAFREGKIWALVTTDLLGRGVDFKAVEMVINYDIPTTAVSYIHRIGRTGRANRTGTAITFFTISDKPYLRAISNVIKNSGQDVPNWMNKIPRREMKSRTGGKKQ